MAAASDAVRSDSHPQLEHASDPTGGTDEAVRIEGLVALPTPSKQLGVSGTQISMWGPRAAAENRDLPPVPPIDKGGPVDGGVAPPTDGGTEDGAKPPARKMSYSEIRGMRLANNARQGVELKQESMPQRKGSYAEYRRNRLASDAGISSGRAMGSTEPPIRSTRLASDAGPVRSSVDDLVPRRKLSYTEMRNAKIGSIGPASNTASASNVPFRKSSYVRKSVCAAVPGDVTASEAPPARKLSYVEMRQCKKSQNAFDSSQLKGAGDSPQQI